MRYSWLPPPFGPVGNEENQISPAPFLICSLYAVRHTTCVVDVGQLRHASDVRLRYGTAETCACDVRLRHRVATMCVFNTATTCVCDVRLRHGTAVTCVCNVRQRRAAATQDSNNISLRSGTTPPRWPPLPSRPPPPWAVAWCWTGWDVCHLCCRRPLCGVVGWFVRCSAGRGQPTCGRQGLTSRRPRSK